jgi:glycine oxidase
VAKGHQVTLFDLDSAEGENAAGLTAAGMLAQFAELESATNAIFHTGVRSIELWPSLLEQIGIPETYQQVGSIITAHHVDMPELEHFISQLRAKVPTALDIQTLDRRQLVELEPDLEQHSKAFYLPSEGQVNAQAFMAASAEYLLKHPQVTWHQKTEVIEILPGLVKTQSDEIEFDWSFDARGFGAKDDLPDLQSCDR